MTFLRKKIKQVEVLFLKQLERMRRELALGAEKIEQQFNSLAISYVRGVV